MKKLKQFFATTVLALALVASVHAGDMTFPPAPPAPPPDHITTRATLPATDGQGDQGFEVPNAVSDVSIFAFDLLCDLLSMY